MACCNSISTDTLSFSDSMFLMTDSLSSSTHDLLGMFEKFTPSFVKQFTHLAPSIKEAVQVFIQEVRDGEFPGEEHSFSMKFDVNELES